MEWPWAGPRTRVWSMSISRVPWSMPSSGVFLGIWVFGHCTTYGSLVEGLAVSIRRAWWNGYGRLAVLRMWGRMASCGRLAIGLFLFVRVLVPCRSANRRVAVGWRL